MFYKGQAKTPASGRQKGTKNRISNSLLEAFEEFAKDFAEHGIETYRTARHERPHEYLKIGLEIFKLVTPQEIEINETRLMEIPDDELDILLEYAAKRPG